MAPPEEQRPWLDRAYDRSYTRFRRHYVQLWLVASASGS